MGGAKAAEARALIYLHVANRANRVGAAPVRVCSRGGVAAGGGCNLSNCTPSVIYLQQLRCGAVATYGGDGSTSLGAGRHRDERPRYAQLRLLYQS